MSHFSPTPQASYGAGAQDLAIKHLGRWVRVRERQSHRSGEVRATKLLESIALGSAQVAP